MLQDAASFVRMIGSIVASIVNALGPGWQFYAAAITMLFLLALLKQVGYRNGD